MYITVGEDGSVHWPCVNPACRFFPGGRTTPDGPILPGTGLSHSGHLSDPEIRLIEEYPGKVILQFPPCECGLGGLQVQVEGHTEEELAEAHPHHGTFGQHPAHARHKEAARQLRAMGKHPQKSSG